MPPLLDLLDHHGIRATFFCVMGPEANLIEIVRLRLLAPKGSKSTLNVSARGGMAAVAKAALLPRGVGHRNPVLLRRIIERGHELQPHGWSHIQWQRNIGGIDVRQHLRLALDTFERATAQRATGFASPGRTWNEEVLAAFDEAGLTYAGDMEGPGPFRPQGHRHLQLPVTRFETIAQMQGRGLSDDAIVSTYVEDIERNPTYCCIYEHPDDLGARQLRLLDRLFAHVRATGREPSTLTEVATAFATR